MWELNLRAQAFYKKYGFTAVGQHVFKLGSDAKSVAQVLLAISRDSKNAVDTIVQNAARGGGKSDPNPVQDLGFKYGRSFEDPDGHTWETIWMDMSAVPPQA